MKTVNQLLANKGRQVYSIHPESSVFEAVQMMADREVGALVVMDGEQLVGILSERDYARKVILQGRSSRETPVRDIMSSRVFSAAPDWSIEQCMAVMTEKRIRHLPVQQAGEMVGMISIGDLIKVIIDDQEFVIRQLENYITS